MVEVPNIVHFKWRYKQILKKIILKFLAFVAAILLLQSKSEDSFTIVII